MSNFYLTYLRQSLALFFNYTQMLLLATAQIEFTAYWQLGFMTLYHINTICFACGLAL